MWQIVTFGCGRSSAAAVDGAPPMGETESEAAEGSPVPIAFVAVTVTVYAVPAVRPVIAQVRPVVVQVAPPGLAVAV